MKDQQYILAKIKEKADALGLKFNRKIFVINILPVREVALINYLTGSPKYDKFGKRTEDRVENLHTFMVSKELKNASVDGSAGLDRKQNNKIIKQIKNKNERRKILAVFGKLKYNYNGKACVATKLGKDIENDVTFHEWVHALLIDNKIGFCDTKGERGVYNESLAVFVEYHLGNYYGRDSGFLKGRYKEEKRSGQNLKFWKSTKYFDDFIRLVEEDKSPVLRKKALIRYFKRLPGPNRARFH
jgi:hypothetical protein